MIKRHVRQHVKRSMLLESLYKNIDLKWVVYLTLTFFATGLKTFNFFEICRTHKCEESAELGGIGKQAKNFMILQHVHKKITLGKNMLKQTIG